MQKFKFFAPSIAFLIVFLHPILLSPLGGDDLPNSLMRGVLELGYQTFWSRIAETISHWWVYEGRFFPISTLEGNLVFYLITGVTAYKFFQLGMVILALSLLVKFVSLKTQRANFTLTLILLGSLGFRSWYDPILMFNSLLPSTAVKVFLALNCFKAFHHEDSALKRNAYLIFGAFLWTLAILQYELIIGFSPLLITPVIMSHPRQNQEGLLSYTRLLLKKGRLEILVGFLTLAYFCAYLFLRPKPQSPTYQASFHVEALFSTYFKQLSGSIPGIAVFLPNEISKPHLIAVWLVLFPFVTFLVLRRPQLPLLSREARLSSLLIALVFIFISPLTAAISPRWQNEVRFGYSYLSVFYQYLGFGLILAVMCDSFIKRKTVHRAFAKAFSITLLTFLLSISHANLAQTTKTMRPTNAERSLIKDSLSDGALSEGLSIVVTASPVPVVSTAYDPNRFVNELFFSMHGGKHVMVFKTIEECAQLCAENYLEFSIQYSTDDHQGEAVSIFTEVVRGTERITFPPEIALVRG